MSTPAALASVGEGRIGVLHGFEPAWPSASVVGPAFTVEGAPGDNLALHHAVAEAAPGDVIVLSVGGERSHAHCGGVLATAARERGIAGIVVDGAVRDRSELEQVGVPVFHRGSSPLKPAKDGPVRLRVPVQIDRVRIESGDLVAADADGIVVVPQAHVDAVIAAAAELEAREQEILAQLAAGRTTVEIYGFEPL